MSAKLTKSSIDRAKPEQIGLFPLGWRAKGLWHQDRQGWSQVLCLQVSCRQWQDSANAANDHRRTWFTLDGRSGARLKRAKLLGRAANGEDPAKEKQDDKKQITVAQLCDLYLEQGIATKKASTIATDKGRIERHIKPLLGRKKVLDVNRADIKRFLQDVANGKTSADIKTGSTWARHCEGRQGSRVADCRPSWRDILICLRLRPDRNKSGSWCQAICRQEGRPLSQPAGTCGTWQGTA